LGAFGVGVSYFFFAYLYFLIFLFKVDHTHISLSLSFVHPTLSLLGGEREMEAGEGGEKKFDFL